MLSGQAIACSALGPQYHGNAPLSSGHEVILGGLIDNLIQNQHGEIDK